MILNAVLFALGMICGCALCLYFLDFHRQLDAELKDLDL